MSIFNNINWKLMAKYLAGEASDMEKEILDNWRNKNSVNNELFIQMNDNWRIIDQIKDEFNVDNAWNKVYNRIKESEGTIIMQDKRNTATGRSLLLRIAAVVLFLVVLSVSALFIYDRVNNVSYTASEQERGKSVQLPDGSSVTLNGNSSVKLAREFNGKLREITLKGEAFFDVVPDSEKPFVVYANNAAVRVVGTSFNVKAERSGDEVQVYVSSGTVELMEINNETNRISLSQGNLGTLKQHTVESVEAKNENSIAWKTGKISFNNLLLSEALNILNELYNVEIVCLNTAANSNRFEKGEHFENESLDVILQVICKQNNLKVEKSGDMIYLSGY